MCRDVFVLCMYSQLFCLVLHLCAFYFSLSIRLHCICADLVVYLWCICIVFVSDGAAITGNLCQWVPLPRAHVEPSADLHIHISVFAHLHICICDSFMLKHMYVCLCICKQICICALTIYANGFPSHALTSNPLQICTYTYLYSHIYMHLCCNIYPQIYIHL